MWCKHNDISASNFIAFFPLLLLFFLDVFPIFQFFTSHFSYAYNRWKFIRWKIKQNAIHAHCFRDGIWFERLQQHLICMKVNRMRKKWNDLFYIHFFIRSDFGRWFDVERKEKIEKRQHFGIVVLFIFVTFGWNQNVVMISSFLIK